MIIARMTKIDLYHALVSNNWSVVRTSEALGCSRSWLFRVMEAQEIKNMRTRPPMTKIRLEMLMDKKHKVVKEVAKEAGLNSSHVNKLIKKWGIKRAVGKPRARKFPTHCKRGHMYTVKNTYVNPNGKGFRVCRRCQAGHSLRKFYERKNNVQSIQHESTGEDLSDLHGTPCEDSTLQVRHAGAEHPHDEIQRRIDIEGEQGSRRNCPSIPENHPGHVS